MVSSRAGSGQGPHGVKAPTPLILQNACQRLFLMFLYIFVDAFWDIRERRIYTEQWNVDLGTYNYNFWGVISIIFCHNF